MRPGKAVQGLLQSKPEALRPSWNETSIRKRNLMPQNGIVNVLELDPERIRSGSPRADRRHSARFITSTKPCGRSRPTCSRYCRSPTERRARGLHGSIHPSSILDFALATAAVLRRADRGASIRPLRDNEKGDEPDRKSEVATGRSPEDDLVFPERHAAGRSRAGQPHSGPLRFRLPSPRADDEHGPRSVCRYAVRFEEGPAPTKADGRGQPPRHHVDAA